MPRHDGLDPLRKADILATLELLCTQGGDAHVPVSVVGKWRGHVEHPAGHVVGHPWLKVVRVDHPDDLRTVADLARRYPTPPSRNQGEMDVVAISKRLGFTALMEDGVGCKQADDHGVAHLAIVTLLACGAACDLLEHKLAWRTHVAVEATRRGYHSILLADRDGRRGFAAAVMALRALRRQQGEPSVARFIAQRDLDSVLLAAARAAMNVPVG
ncbi:MAG TPA: hypothetical protein VK506_03770 [Conexibacter sp.]|nr:hypothetical protein [Conexibacter sp.]